MKYINNKILILIVTVVIMFFGNTMPINAASASISGGGTVTVGGTINITISAHAPGGFFQATSSSSNASIATVQNPKLMSNAPDDSETANPPTRTIAVKGISVGNTQVTVNVQGDDFSGASFNTTKVIHINVVAPSTPSPGGGNSSGGNSSTGGSNTIDRPTQVETEAERIARLEREAAAKKEAEEREEAARKEAEAKIPLVTALEVISKSDKHLDKVIKSFDIEESVYEYAYDLPMFIEDISLKVTGAEGATIDYEADHSITGEKSIIIKASKGEVSQEYTLKLSPSKFEKIVTDDGTVYQDEVLDTAFSDLGYEVKDVEFEGKPVRMFSKDKMNLQMIMNDKKEVSFYRLNDDGSKIENGSVLLMNDEILFVRNELPEELESKTLYGQSYKDVELPALEFLEEVDSSLASKQVAKGWKFDDGSVVNAVNSDLGEDLYYVSAESNVKAAVVAFDASNPTLMYALIGVSTLLVASLMGLVYMILQSRKNRVHI